MRRSTIALLANLGIAFAAVLAAGALVGARLEPLPWALFGGVVSTLASAVALHRKGWPRLEIPRRAASMASTGILLGAFVCLRHQDPDRGLLHDVLSALFVGLVVAGCQQVEEWIAAGGSRARA